MGENYYRSFDPIIKSPLDPLEYKAIQLYNQLKAVVISNERGKDPPVPREDKCIVAHIHKFNAEHFDMESPLTASDIAKVLKPLRRESSMTASKRQYQVIITIGSGMLSDTLPGMAHFVEHLLFFGSKKYPEMESFTKFLKLNNGDTNATTGAEFTCFEFNVDVKGIDEALDRFTDLLINPIWKSEDILQEINAVNSEFWRLWMHDSSRYKGVLHHLANPFHPLHKVGFGHGYSLDVFDVERLARNWKTTHYVSNNMSVIMVGPESTDEMVKKVVKYFSGMPPSPPSKLSPREGLVDMYGNMTALEPKQWNQTYRLIPTWENNFLFLSWLLPTGVGQHLKTKPLTLLSYIMTNKSAGGLEDSLRRKGWLLHICAQCHSVENTCLTTIFMVTLFLTEDGIKHSEDVVREVFLFFQMVQASPTKELRRIFTELRQVQCDAFHYRSDLNIATTHFIEDLEPASMDDEDGNQSINILKMFSKFLLTQKDKDIGRLLIDIFVSSKWDEGTIRETLMPLLDPSNANVMVASKSFADGGITEKILWFNITYGLAPTNFLTDQNIYGGWSFWRALWGKRAHTWGSPGSRKYFLPPRNKYASATQCIPTTKKVLSKQYTFYEDKKLAVNCYPGQCRRGYLSTCCYYFLVKTDVGLRSVQDGTYPLMALVAKCWEHILETKLADALTTTISMHVKKTCDKLTAMVKGPSAQLPTIFETVVDTFDNLETLITPLLYGNIIQEILNYLEEEKSNSEKFITKLLQMVLDLHVCSRRTYEDVYKIRTFDEFIQFIKQLKSEMRIEVDLVGCISNIDATEVFKILQTLEYSKRNPKTKPCGKNFRLELPLEGKKWRYSKPSYNTAEAHHWILNYHQIESKSEIDPRERNALYAIARNMSDHAYYHLRGEKHIGYFADASEVMIHSVFGLTIRVNALAYRFSPEYVEEAIDNFVSLYYNRYIMNKDYFRKYIDIDKDVGWGVAKKFFQKYLLPSGRNYKRLSLHVTGHVEGVPQNLRWNPTLRPKPGRVKRGVVEIQKNDLLKWKNSLQQFPNSSRNDDNSSDEE